MKSKDKIKQEKEQKEDGKMKQVLVQPKKIEKKQKEVKEQKEKSISDLPGVGAATAEKLLIVGYKDLMSIAVATPGELVDVGGVSEATAKKMIAAARTSMDMGFESGDDLLKRRARVEKIP